MSKIQLHISILLAFGILTSSGVSASIFGSSTEEDCVIEAMRSAQSNDAAAIARKACEDKFERLELQSTRELKTDELSRLNISAKLSSVVPLNSMTPAIQKAIQDGSYYKKYGANSLEVIVTSGFKNVIVRQITVELFVDSESQGTYTAACRLKPGKTAALRIDIKPVRNDQQWTYRLLGGIAAPTSY